MLLDFIKHGKAITFLVIFSLKYLNRNRERRVWSINPIRPEEKPFGAHIQHSRQKLLRTF